MNYVRPVIGLFRTDFLFHKAIFMKFIKLQKLMLKKLSWVLLAMMEYPFLMMLSKIHFEIMCKQMILTK